MEKKSILFLSNAYPDFDSSYHGIFIKKMASLIQKEGFEISVVSPKIYRGSRYFEDQRGIKVYRFPFFARNKQLIEYEKIPYLRMILYYISGLFFTVFALLKHRCNIIHAHWAIPTGLIGVIAGALLGKPLIITIHGSDFRMATAKSCLLRTLFVYVCKEARSITAVSELIKRGVEKFGIEGEKISVFPMGIDQGFLEVGKNRERDINRKPLRIISNRNLFPIYNILLLIRAIPLVLAEEPEARFIIAGDGPERENLKRETERLNVGTSVQFLGKVPHDEMPNLLCKSDIYISTSFHDGTSVSLLEAMACGTFPIVTDILSNREWVSDGINGFLIPAENETLLARRIIEAIRNPGLLKESIEKNQKIVEQKALWETNIKEISKTYERLIRSN